MKKYQHMKGSVCKLRTVLYPRFDGGNGSGMCAGNELKHLVVAP
jgi:hypothetical protein